jgi:hypothetical protein
MSLADLISIAPPPATGARPHWPDVERAVGSVLPSEYKAVVEAYGLGNFGDCLTLFTPDATQPHLNLIEWAADPSEMTAAHADTPEYFPYPGFPRENGLFGFGAGENWQVFYWLTGGSPDEWPILVYENRGPDFHRLEMPLTDVVVGLLTGKLKISVFPADFEMSNPRFEPFSQ